MPDDKTLLEIMKHNCLEGIRIIGMGIGPVVILGKSFNEAAPLERTVQAIDRWLAGNPDGHTQPTLDKLKDEYRRMHLISA